MMAGSATGLHFPEEVVKHLLNKGSRGILARFGQHMGFGGFLEDAVKAGEKIPLFVHDPEMRVYRIIAMITVKRQAPHHLKAEHVEQASISQYLHMTEDFVRKAFFRAGAANVEREHMLFFHLAKAIDWLPGDRQALVPEISVRRGLHVVRFAVEHVHPQSAVANLDITVPIRLPFEAMPGSSSSGAAGVAAAAGAAISANKAASSAGGHEADAASAAAGPVAMVAKHAARTAPYLRAPSQAAIAGAASSGQAVAASLQRLQAFGRAEDSPTFYPFIFSSSSSSSFVPVLAPAPRPVDNDVYVNASSGQTVYIRVPGGMTMRLSVVDFGRGNEPSASAGRD